MAAGVGAWILVAVTGIGTQAWRAAHRPCGAATAIEAVPARGFDLVEVPGAEDIQAPVALAPMGRGAMIVGTRPGDIWLLRHGSSRLIFDLTPAIETQGDGGLLGLAIAPDHAWLYAYFTPRGGTAELRAYPLDLERSPPAIVDEGVTMLQISFETDNHAGGALVFGPDSWLYLGVGDGGSTGDLAGEGQSAGSLPGSILRIHPSPSQQPPYAVADTSPFGTEAAPEVAAIGLRNPFRMAFDSSGGAWIADPGDACVDEVDHVASGQLVGANFGWNRFEGSRSYVGGEADEFERPVAEFPHVDGWCSVVGGAALRVGPEDSGFLAGDYCTGRILVVTDTIVLDTGRQLDGLVSIAGSPDGQVFVASLTEGLRELTLPSPSGIALSSAE